MTDVTESEDAVENALLPPALARIAGLGPSRHLIRRMKVLNGCTSGSHHGDSTEDDKRGLFQRR